MSDHSSKISKLDLSNLIVPDEGSLMEVPKLAEIEELLSVADEFGESSPMKNVPNRSKTSLEEATNNMRRSSETAMGSFRKMIDGNKNKNSNDNDTDNDGDNINNNGYDNNNDNNNNHNHNDDDNDDHENDSGASNNNHTNMNNNDNDNDNKSTNP